MKSYADKVRVLSQRLVEAQRPIRILDAIKWDPGVEEAIRESGYKSFPRLNAETYARIPLGFDPYKKKDELSEIARDIESTLGTSDDIGRLLKTMAEQYRDVVEMLLHRGTKRFWELSKELYGSPKDKFFGDTNTISDLGAMLYSILSRIDEQSIGPEYPENLSAEEVVEVLNRRFQGFFKDEDGVRARISDGIVADAAAGSDVVKIRESSRFSSRDVDILEVHEGWVHVGSTRNGLAQRHAQWLSKGPPRVASTQEGLAVIMEIFTFRSFPRRAKQINDRLLGIDRVEDGANILELIEYYRTEGYSETDCLTNARRVFRGGALEGGAPFTKDIVYCKGFIENYNFMRAALRAGQSHLLPFLFAGKLHVDDVPMLYQKHREGLVDAPKYLPPQFQDLSGIAVWMSFSNFFNQVDMKRIQEHYDKLFTLYS